jgi:hypothetical protein
MLSYTNHGRYQNDIVATMATTATEAGIHADIVPGVGVPASRNLKFAIANIAAPMPSPTTTPIAAAPTQEKNRICMKASGDADISS